VFFTYLIGRVFSLFLYIHNNPKSFADTEGASSSAPAGANSSVLMNMRETTLTTTIPPATRMRASELPRRRSLPRTSLAPSFRRMRTMRTAAAVAATTTRMTMTETTTTTMTAMKAADPRSAVGNQAAAAAALLPRRSPRAMPSSTRRPKRRTMTRKMRRGGRRTELITIPTTSSVVITPRRIYGRSSSTRRPRS